MTLNSSIMKTNVKKIALTGGIGSGKSYALQVLKDAGFFVVSCDEVYFDLFESAAFKRKLKKLFPSAVKGVFKLTADRKIISQIVFSDKTKLKALNDLTHPLILKECLKRTDGCGKAVAVIEVPLLFEGGYQNLFDGVIVLMRDKAERVASVMARSNLTETEVLARISNQIDYDALDKTPYTVVINDGVNFKNAILDAVKNI